jgi:hypothetical protein
MKRIAKIKYPYTVLNTIEVDISDFTEDEVAHLKNNLYEQVDLIELSVPGYESTDITMCKAAREIDMYSFQIIETDGTTE